MLRLETRGASQLRTKYVPRSRLGQGLVSMAPWADLVLLLLGFLLVNGRLVLEPGVAVSLPGSVDAAVRAADLTAVVQVVGGSGGAQEVIYFGDQRYILDDQARLGALREALVSRTGRLQARSLAIHADRLVRHGTLVILYDLAREAGLERVTLLTRTERSAPGTP